MKKGIFGQFIPPFKSDGTDITPRIPGQNIDAGTGLYKDNDATVGIALADSGNTTFDTINKSITGAVNENKSQIDLLKGIGAYTTKTDPAFDNISVSDVDDFIGCVITLTVAGSDQNLPAPTDTARFHVFTVINNDTSTDPIDIIGSGTRSLQPGDRVLMVWDGTAWIASEDPGLWSDDGSDLKAKNSTRNIDSQSGIYKVAGSQISAKDILVALGVGSPTVDQIQEYFDNIGSSGYFTGGEITDGGAGTIDVAAGSGFIRATNDDNAPLLSFKWAASAGIAVTDDTTQYVFVDDAGAISLSADEFLEAPDKIMLGLVTDESGAIESVFNLGVRLEESIGQAGRFIRRTLGILRDIRKGGLIFGETGTRNVTLSAGTLWWGRTEYPITALDTSVSGGFDTYSAAGQEAAAATQWPNEQYDNAGTLTTLTDNRWAVLWFYIEPDDHVVMLYGRDQYVTEAQAELELPPSTSIPPRIFSSGVLAAKFIFQKSASTASISSTFDIVFPSNGVTAHSGLSGLTADDHTQYLLLAGRGGVQTVADDVTFDGIVKTRIKVNDKSSSTSIALIDDNAVAEFTNGASDLAYTFEEFDTVPLTLGAWGEVRKKGSGEITITRGVNVTFDGDLGDVDFKINGADGKSVFWEVTATTSGATTVLWSGSVKAV